MRPCCCLSRSREGELELVQPHGRPRPSGPVEKLNQQVVHPASPQAGDQLSWSQVRKEESGTVNHTRMDALVLSTPSVKVLVPLVSPPRSGLAAPFSAFPVNISTHGGAAAC